MPPPPPNKTDHGSKCYRNLSNMEQSPTRYIKKVSFNKYNVPIHRTQVVETNR